jgi:hypothetical protein
VAQLSVLQNVNFSIQPSNGHKFFGSERRDPEITRMRWVTYNRLLDKLRAADSVADERLRRVLISAARPNSAPLQKSASL